ncbi:4466_t:CDS:2, partial [Acaulospora colombiana]
PRNFPTWFANISHEEGADEAPEEPAQGPAHAEVRAEPRLVNPDEVFFETVMNGLDSHVREALMSRIADVIRNQSTETSGSTVVSTSDPGERPMRLTDPIEIPRPISIHDSSSEPDSPTTVIPVAGSSRQAGSIPRPASPQRVRFTTAQKGKFKAVSIPRPPGHQGIFIAPDPNSEEGMEAALRESDRQAALRAQEEEDLRAATELSNNVNAIENASNNEADEPGDDPHSPVSPLADRINPTSSNRADPVPRTPKRKKGKNPNDELNRLVQNNASASKVRRDARSKTPIPPSRQMPGNSTLFNKLLPTRDGIKPDRRRQNGDQKRFSNEARPADKKTMVSTLSNFLEGKALRTFMSIVAPSVNRWTVESVINMFFDELFPTNIRQTLRERFEQAEQGQLSVREWRQKIIDLAARVPDIDDAAKARRFWKGSKGYFRIKWAREGYNAEFDSFNDLYDAALRIEQEELQIRAERNSNNRTELRSSMAEHSDKKKKHNGKKRSENRDKKRDKDDRKDKPKSESKDSNKSRPSGSSNRKPMSQKEKDELRATGKCFRCKEIGHLYKDCPSRTTSKPPTLSSNAVSFSTIEARMKDVTDLGSCSITIPGLERDDLDFIVTRAEVICSWAKLLLEENLNSNSVWPTHLDRFADRFSVTHVEERYDIFHVFDYALDIEFFFTSEELSDPEFNLVYRAEDVIEENKQYWSSFAGKSTHLDDSTNPELLPSTSSIVSSPIDLPKPKFPSPSHGQLPQVVDEEEKTYLSDSSSSETEAGDHSNESNSSDEDEFRQCKIVYFDSDDDEIEEKEGYRVDAFVIANKPSTRKSRVEGRKPDRVLLERNAARPKDFERLVPKTCVIDAFIKDEPVRVLIDTGSMSDFLSTTLVDQLKIETDQLAQPLTVQLAVTGSRGKIHSSATTKIRYEEIEETRRFDVMNIDGYDAILGTPFLFQHKGIIGFNPTRFAYGSIKSLPIEGVQVAHFASRAATLLEENLDKQLTTIFPSKTSR